MITVALAKGGLADKTIEILKACAGRVYAVRAIFFNAGGTGEVIL